MKKGTRKVLIGTLTVTALIVVYSFFHYGQINSAEDPRILPAKKLLQKYEKQLEEDQGALALNILDEIVRIYTKTPGYDKSFEIGVMQNNMATVHLVDLETKILTDADIDKEEMLETLLIAQKHTLNAIEIYEKWMAEMGKMSEQQIREYIAPFFKKDDPAFKDADSQEVFEKRVQDILLAQIETKRRMSVSLTNLGFINRYKGNLEEAKKNYESAISLWERNYTAQDNLNMLLNKPIKKRSMIDKLFPPEKDKEKENKNS